MDDTMVVEPKRKLLLIPVREEQYAELARRAKNCWGGDIAACAGDILTHGLSTAKTSKVDVMIAFVKSNMAFTRWSQRAAGE